MGASLCCMKSSQPPTIATSSSTILIAKKSPLCTRNSKIYEAREEEEEEEEEEERVDNGITTTLKDWLLQSPNNNGCNHHHALMNPTKLQLRLNTTSPPSQVTSSPEVRREEFYTPRISFSSDNRSGKLITVDERDEDENDQGISKRNGSRSLKKKVSFRFPREADIFIFYSPKQDFVTIDN